MCIEDLLKDDIINNLKLRYGKDSTEQVLLILCLRAYVYNIKNMSPKYDNYLLNSELLSKFIIEEFNIPNIIQYKNNNVSLNNRYAENCLLNITDSLLYDCLENEYNGIKNNYNNGNDLIKELFLNYHNNIKSKINKIRGENKKLIYKYLLLQEINNDFNIKEIKTVKIKNINYFNSICINYDNYLNEIYINYIKNNNKEKEKDLEKYIIKNGIEDIKIINHQMKINSGIIDLLGVDSQNNKVLIELKVVENPKDLLWQIKSYTNDLIKDYPNLRTLIISPKLNEKILNQLPNYCEIIYFKKLKNKYLFERRK